jgi:methionyl-tRNA formyltransferase
LDEVDNILQDKAKFIDQDHTKATYANKIEKSEGQISWNDNASKIIGKINGLFPTPGAFFNFCGERYKILKAEIGSGVGQAGEVLSNRLEIACANKESIKIFQIQRQGKKPQKIEEFMLGSNIKKGTFISND